jgi:hypothetical protein
MRSLGITLVRFSLAAIVAATFATQSVIALSPGTDVLIPAAARIGPWITDLYLLNLGQGDTDVQLQWLVRGQANPDPQLIQITLNQGETRVLADVVASAFGLDLGEGAIRIIASDRVVANCRIFAREGDATYGQGFEGVPSAAATPAGATTHVVGLATDGGFRSNIYALAGSDGAVIELTLRRPSGQDLASAALDLAAWEPYLEPSSSVFGGGQFDDAIVEVRISSGWAVVGASKIDRLTTDPTTLASWVEARSTTRMPAGSYFGAVIRPDTAAAGGFALELDAAEGVTGLELSFPSARCPVLFAAGQDLADQPVSLAIFEAGYVFSSSYPSGGSMEWTIRLDADAEGPKLEGTVSAAGSGWQDDLSACNGAHQAKELSAGIRLP